MFPKPTVSRATPCSALAAPFLGLLLAGTLLAPEPLVAQDPPGAPTAGIAPEVRGLERMRLSGPRFGFTVFTGDVADQRRLGELEPIMTQFGWQFETRIISLSNGGQALMEWIPLVGGVEQGELNLSLAWLTGYRLASGVEFGVGPNLSYNRDQDRTTSSMVVAGGATLPFGEIQIPLNMAVGIAQGGPRFTVLMGWIIG
jgi:hypothetical protein